MSGSENRPDAAGWFGDPIAQQQIKQRSVRGGLITGLSGAVVQLVRLASLVFLARLLTPADFGIVAMITAIIGIADVLRDLGLSAAVIRASSITHAQVSNLFWVNVLGGAVATLLVIVGAPHLETFYEDPRVGTAAMVLGVSFLLSAAATQHQALLRRSMRFIELARVRLLSAFTTASISIWAAFHGAGYWALVIGSIAGGTVGLLLTWTLCDWRPGAPRRGTGVRSMMVFGTRLVGFNVLGFVSGNLHSLLIGKFWDAADAGIYNRAERLGMLLSGLSVGPLTQVVPSAMARLTAYPKRLSNFYYKACTLSVIAAMPVTFAGLVQPKELVLLFLGDQWLRTVDLLQWLAVGILPNTIMHSTGWVYLSTGNSLAMLRWGMLGWSATIAATVIGAQFSILAIAISAATVSLTLVIPALLFAFQETPLRIRHLVRQLFKPLATGLVTGLIFWWVLDRLPLTNNFVRLLIGSGGFTMVYGLLLMSLPTQRHLILDTAAQLRRKTP